MSMLSAQCDELRQMAESVGLAMPQAATLMMEAADTILELCEQAEDMDFQLDKWKTKAEYFKQLADLAEAENANLRSELESVGTAAYLYGRSDLKAENAKLREQVERLHADQAHWELGNCPSCPNIADLQEALEQNAKLRELAVLNWEWAHSCCGNNCKMQTDGCGYQIDRECNYEREIYDRMRELGVEVTA